MLAVAVRFGVDYPPGLPGRGRPTSQRSTQMFQELRTGNDGSQAGCPTSGGAARPTPFEAGQAKDKERPAFVKRGYNGRENGRRSLRSDSGQAPTPKGIRGRPPLQRKRPTARNDLRFIAPTGSG
jgi:hypothetical protein